MINTPFRIVNFSGKRQGYGMREKYTGGRSDIDNGLPLKLGGGFISDQFIIMFHKGHIFFRAYDKIHMIKIKWKTN